MRADLAPLTLFRRGRRRPEENDLHNMFSILPNFDFEETRGILAYRFGMAQIRCHDGQGSKSKPFCPCRF